MDCPESHGYEEKHRSTFRNGVDRPEPPAAGRSARDYTVIT
jgi:hypothetical protein